MEIMSLLNAMPGACAQGLIWGLMAIGVYITYRVLDIADLTVDGTMCTGGAVCVVLMMNGCNVYVALLCAFIAGMLAGLVTGVFHTVMRYPGDSGRHTDPAGALFDQPAHTGHAPIRASARDKYDLLLVRCVRDSAGHFGGRDLHSAAHRADVLVLRHGAGLLAARHRQPTCTWPARRASTLTARPCWA